MKILIDMDSVLYDICTPWYALHNAEYGHIHILKAQDVDEWNTQAICDRNNCPADIYKYLLDKRVWTDGTVIQNSQEITRQWNTHDLAVVTAVGNSIAPNRKVSWLHEHFPHIKNYFIVSGKQKHWIAGDILIDDAPHNLEHFTGVSILFDQPWNQGANYPRARDWNHVQAIVDECNRLFDNNTFLYMKENAHKIIERMLNTMIKDGVL